MRKPHLLVQANKLPRRIWGSIGPRTEICTKAMFISKGSCWYVESKNVFRLSVHKPHLLVWACKLPRLMWGGISSRTKICGSSGLPFAIVPYLHQTTVYIKRNLRIWRVQNVGVLRHTFLSWLLPQTCPSSQGVSQVSVQSSGSCWKSSIRHLHGSD